MSKKILSDIDGYSGSVVIPTRFTAPQYMLWKKTSEALARAKTESGGQYDEMAASVLPGVIGLVESWEIEGLTSSPTLENFPMTPILSAIRFLLVVWGEINEIVMPTVETPNESSPQP